VWGMVQGGVTCSVVATSKRLDVVRHGRFFTYGSIVWPLAAFIPPADCGYNILVFTSGSWDQEARWQFTDLKQLEPLRRIFQGWWFRFS
jgi:hypothetical protein